MRARGWYGLCNSLLDIEVEEACKNRLFLSPVSIALFIFLVVPDILKYRIVIRVFFFFGLFPFLRFRYYSVFVDLSDGRSTGVGVYTHVLLICPPFDSFLLYSHHCAMLYAAAVVACKHKTASSVVRPSQVIFLSTPAYYIYVLVVCFLLANAKGRGETLSTLYNLEPRLSLAPTPHVPSASRHLLYKQAVQ